MSQAKMTAEEKLVKIAAIFNTETPEGGVVISTHAGHNMNGALIDLDRIGRPDRVIMNTFRRVRDQFAEIEKVLNM